MDYAKLFLYLVTAIDAATALLDGANDLKQTLADARANGKVTDEQWAELESKLAAAENARRAAVAAV